MAQIMARNYLLAEYVANNSTYHVSEDALEQLKSYQAAVDDLFHRLLTGEGLNLYESSMGGDLDALRTAAANYIAVVDGRSQAQADAEAFYALMSTIDAASTSDADGNVAHDTADSDEYMASMRAYANMIGAVLNNQVSAGDVSEVNAKIDASDSVVVICATKTNGVLSFTVSPADADPRDSGDSGETEKVAPTDKTTSIAATITEDSIVITPSTIATKYGSNALIATLTAPDGWTIDVDESGAIASDTKLFEVKIYEYRGGTRRLSIQQGAYGQGTWGSATIAVVLKNSTDSSVTKTLSTTIDLYALN